MTTANIIGLVLTHGPKLLSIFERRDELEPLDIANQITDILLEGLPAASYEARKLAQRQGMQIYGFLIPHLEADNA